MNLPGDVQKIISVIELHGQAAYAVGGCVRDSILGKTPADWDITTSAKPEEVKEWFNKTFDTGIEHGTVTVLMHGVGYEVTTYRVDGKYEDGRHPKQVTFTASLEEDLLRRDFTINAMAYNDSTGLVDLYGGMDDLKNKVIRAVGNPKERFSEDALRMLRALRFSAQLGFDIEPDTYEAIKELAPTLEKISAERIQVELVKLLMSDHPEKIEDVYKSGLTKVFLPEFDAMMNTPQKCLHHCYGVGEHTIVTLKNIAPTRVLRLAALLHDVGKPSTIHQGDDGFDLYTDHEKIGAEMAKGIMRRLKFDNATIKAVANLVYYHETRPEITMPNMRRMIIAIGVDAFYDSLALNKADVLAQSDYMREKKFENIEKMRSFYDEIIKNGDCLSIKDMDITGKDLMDLGVNPGKEMGEMLEVLLEEILDNPELNNRKYLVERVKSFKVVY